MCHDAGWRWTWLASGASSSKVRMSWLDPGQHVNVLRGSLLERSGSVTFQQLAASQKTKVSAGRRLSHRFVTTCYSARIISGQAA
jgi:hypothetical protein